MITKANLESENMTGHNTLGPNANRPLHLLTASSIIGDKVENRQEQNIGKIKDIMINLNDGRIEYMVIEFGGFLGIGEKLFAVPFSKLRLNHKKENFELDVNKSVLEGAPGFDPTHWPETNSHYLDVDTYWGSFVSPHTGILSI
jgi:sporulation protein YlmC with PRC-barrel domain